MLHAPGRKEALPAGWGNPGSRRLGFDEDRRRVLEALLERLDHGRRVVAVDEAVVEGRGQVHGTADGDDAIEHHRTLHRAVDADDADLRRVDDRRAGNAAELAEA